MTSSFNGVALRLAMEMWFRALRAEGASERTIENHRYQVGRFVLMMEEMGCQTLEDVQADHIRRMLIHYREKKVSSHTLHNYYRNPRAFWNWCLREGLTEHNPFAKVGPPKKEPEANDFRSSLLKGWSESRGKSWRITTFAACNMFL